MKRQLLFCFPELQRVLDAVRSRQNKIAESEHTQQQTEREQGVPDCRAALTATLRGYNPVIENVLPAIEDPQVQSLAKEIAHDLEGQEVTSEDVTNPRAALAGLLEKFRGELRSRVVTLPAGHATIVLQSWLSNMQEPTIISCFPAIIPVGRAFADKLRAGADEARKRQAESTAQAQAPRNVLGRAYASYMFIKRCYDAREGYAAVYISQPEMEQARGAVRQIEEFIKPKLESGTTADQLAANDGSRGEHLPADHRLPNWNQHAMPSSLS